MEALTPLILWLAQLLLGVQCQCPTEGIVEHQATGTWYGAISEATEVSVGLWVGFDGDITFEHRAP